jgi:hypothetical protein
MPSGLNQGDDLVGGWTKVIRGPEDPGLEYRDTGHHRILTTTTGQKIVVLDICPGASGRCMEPFVTGRAP